MPYHITYLIVEVPDSENLVYPLDIIRRYHGSTRVVNVSITYVVKLYRICCFAIQ